MLASAFLMRAKVAFAALFLVGLTACETIPVDITDKSLKSIPVVHLVTPGVRIEARDGSFKLVSGQQAYTPFEMDIWSQNSQPFSDNTILNGFSAAKPLGAKDVAVYIEGRSAPLYGVLILSKVYNAATGPGTRSYRIDIPQDKIDAAYSGVTAVVYEDVAFQQLWSTGGQQTHQFRSWILWLSSTPI